MRVDLNNSAASQITGETNTQSSSVRNTPAPDTAETGDRTTLTSGSTSVSSLVTQALNTPDIRQDIVESLQQAIGSGQYQLDPDQIAGAMIDEHA